MPDVPHELSGSGRALAAVRHRSQGAGVNPSGPKQHQTTQTSRRVARGGILTAVATGDRSMSRCGLMELMYQGALVVGSGEGIPGPINSLESIPGPGLMRKMSLFETG